MSILNNLSTKESIDLLTFFPALELHVKINTTNQLKQFSDKNIKALGHDKNLVLSELIKTYFKLSSYPKLDLEKFTLRDWAAQFIVRKNIIDKLNSDNNSRSLNNQEEQHLQRSIFELISQPVIDHNSNPFMFMGNSSSVADLQLSSLSGIIDIPLIKSNLESFEYLHNSMKNYPDLSLKEHEIELLTSSVNDLMPSDNKTRLILTIDLSHNDEQIKKDLEKYLVSKRKLQNIQPVIDKPLKVSKSSEYMKHKVLQYLDLKILDLYINNQKTLTQEGIAKIIFPEFSGLPEDIGNTDKVRKTTIPLAEKALTRKNISQLLIESNTSHFSFLDE